MYGFKNAFYNFLRRFDIHLHLTKTTMLETLYWWVAIGSSSFLGFKILLNLFGLDFDYEVDFDFDLDFDTGLSLSTVAGFLSAGGWTGVLAYKMTELGDGLVSLAAGVAGLIGFAGSFWVLKNLKYIEETGNIQLENAIGEVAEVYLTIPEDGVGQIRVLIQGRLKVFNAICADKTSIQTGEKVFIFDLQDHKFIVEKYHKQLEINS